MFGGLGIKSFMIQKAGRPPSTQLPRLRGVLPPANAPANHRLLKGNKTTSNYSIELKIKSLGVAEDMRMFRYRSGTLALSWRHIVFPTRSRTCVPNPIVRPYTLRRDIHLELHLNSRSFLEEVQYSVLRTSYINGELN